MSITLTANYKETLPAEIVEIINDLVEDAGYDLDEVLTTYDYFGEKYAEDLERIIETLEDTDATRSELHDFLEEHGINDLEYFEKYKNLRDDHDPDAVDAYIELCGYVGCVDSFEDAYEGYYDRVEDFVDYIIEGYGETIPSWIVIDAEQTWNCSLRHDYSEQDGHYFRDI